MHETNETKVSTWKRPLKSRGWLAAWASLIACMTAITWVVLGLTSNGFSDAPTALRGLLCIGIALTAAILIGLAVRCLSSWRNFKRFLLGLACLAGLIAMFYAEENLRGRLVWGHFKTQWEAKGEKFDFAAFIPPSVPDEQNFAMAPVVATTYGQILDRNGHRVSPPDTNVVNRLQLPLDARDGGPTNGIGNWQKALTSDLEPWQRYYRNLSLTTNLFPVAPQPQSPAADVLLALSKYDSAIEELRQAAARPASRFPLNYDSEEPFAILLPHLAPDKGCAVVLRLRALAELEAGQSEVALADISLALRLTQKIRSEPFLISHLVRIAMLQITEQAIWEGLAKHRWTEAQLSELDQQLAALDFVADYQAAMRGENACEVASIDYLRHHPDKLDSIGESGENDSIRLGNLSSHLVPSGWFYQNELSSSKFILEQFLPIADLGQQTISPSLVKNADESLRAMRLTPYTVICRMLLPGLAHSAHRFAFAQTAVNLARIGCALERYRLAQGKYPETLDVLAPQFIAKVPHDLIGGQPLHYRPTESGHFILYSIGWNEEDDGGTVRLTKSGMVDLDNGDWVWRYPD
jgi:tetratricopeptide (TPR) repeat protein